MRKRPYLYFGVIALLLITGCASIISGRMQSIPVSSSPAGAKVTYNNQTQMTPCTIILDRKSPVVQLTIEKEGHKPVTISLKRTLNGWVFGNVLFGIFGGIIGVAIDSSTGASMKFTPDSIDVRLVTNQKKEVRE